MRHLLGPKLASGRRTMKKYILMAILATIPLGGCTLLGVSTHTSKDESKQKEEKDQGRELEAKESPSMIDNKTGDTNIHVDNVAEGAHVTIGKPKETVSDQLNALKQEQIKAMAAMEKNHIQEKQSLSQKHESERKQLVEEHEESSLRWLIMVISLGGLSIVLSMYGINTRKLGRKAGEIAGELADKGRELAQQTQVADTRKETIGDAMAFITDKIHNLETVIMNNGISEAEQRRLNYTKNILRDLRGILKGKSRVD